MKENYVGADLNYYCQKVVEDKDDEPKAQFFELNSFSELDLGSSFWEAYDSIIYNEVLKAPGLLEPVLQVR